MALASNTNPHSLGGGAVMPGCVVLVSNLNEKVGIFVHKLCTLTPPCCVFVALIFLCYLLTFPLSSSWVYSRLPPSTNYLFKMITPHALFILFGMCSLLTFSCLKECCEQTFLYVLCSFCQLIDIY